MNSAGRKDKFLHDCRIHFYLLALSLAASMFEGSGPDTDTLADTDTGLYILGIKYKTPNGK
jgi:hypothetical protein